MLTPIIIASLVLNANARLSVDQIQELRRLNLTLAELTLYGAVVSEGSSNDAFQIAAREALRLQRVLEDEIYISNIFDKTYDESSAELTKLTASERGQINALLGYASYLSGRDDEAIDFLSNVTSDTPMWARAQYTLAVLKTERARSEADLQSGTRIFAEIAENKNTPRDVAALANMALGRLAYRQGNFADAVRYYERIGVNSSSFARARFELGYARFRNGDPSGALSALAVFQSPQFKDEYMPELPVLTATIAASLCRYDQALVAIDEFEKRYAPLVPELERRVKGEGGGIETLPPGLRRWLLAPRRLNGFARLIAQADRELIVLGDSIRLTEPAAALRALREALIRAQSTATKRRLEDALKSLRDYALRTEAARFEIVRASQETADKGVSAAPKKSQRPRFSMKQTIWPLDGEYWSDELASIQIQVPSACSETRP